MAKNKNATEITDVDQLTLVLFNLSTAGLGSVNELLAMEWTEVYEYQYLLDCRNVL